MKRILVVLNDQEEEYLKNLLNTDDLKSIDLKMMLLSGYVRAQNIKIIIDSFIELIQTNRAFTFNDISFGCELTQSERSMFSKYLRNHKDVYVVGKTTHGQNLIYVKR